MYVAVGDNGTVLLSTDGATWSAPTTTATTDNLLGVADGDGLLTDNGSRLMARIDSGKLDLGTRGTLIDIFVDEEAAKSIIFEATVADLKIADKACKLRLRTPFGVYHMPHLFLRQTIKKKRVVTNRDFIQGRKIFCASL